MYDVYASMMLSNDVAYANTLVEVKVNLHHKEWKK